MQVSDPQAKRSFELDVVAQADGETVDGKPSLLAIGEAKSSTVPRGLADIARLERLRSLLTGRANVAGARLLLFSRSGFDADVIAHARQRRDVELVDLERLYGGD